MTTTSVVISTKNGEHFIARALTSVYLQSNPPLETIVVDTQSIDKTIQVVHVMAQKYPSIRIIAEKPMGPGEGRHIAISQAKGDYIAIIDDDDYWLSKDKLKIQSEYLDLNPNVSVVGSDIIKKVTLDEKLLSIYKTPNTDQNIRRSILRTNPFVNSSVMFRKSKYMEVGGFKSMYLAEDYDLWLRMLQSSEGANLSECDICYTVRNKSLSNDRKLEMFKVTEKLVKEYGKFYPGYTTALIKAKLRILLFDFKNLF
jgi:glycosyltransferase involved in cell wall biosynthesis